MEGGLDYGGNGKEKKTNGGTWIILLRQIIANSRRYMYSSNSYYGTMGTWGSISSEPPSVATYTPTTAKYGRTGLGNVGNTCYMNTAIQVGSECIS